MGIIQCVSYKIMNLIDIMNYSSLVFDCDGVILDSNHIKTDAFYQVALPYGETQAHELREYHIQNGGISRYKKFEYFLSHILKRPVDKKELEELLANFSHIVKDALLSCDVASGLDRLRSKTLDSNWFIVSGGDQQELREVFKKRDIKKYFNGGVYGSPDTKYHILRTLRESGDLELPAIFFGDSKYDHEVATHADMDFVFCTDWTEVSDWKEWTDKNNIITTNNIEQLG